jgi:preprotein translocase subunit SecE
MEKTTPVEFLRQVRQEVGRVTWPSRKETVTTTVMVFLMVFLAALFFFLVDQLLYWGVGRFLSLGGGA